MLVDAVEIAPCTSAARTLTSSAPPLTFCNARTYLPAGLRGLIDAARDLLRRGALLLDRRGDRTGYAIEFLDFLPDLSHRGRRSLSRRLYFSDKAVDFLSRLRGLMGERLHFRSHDGEASLPLPHDPGDRPHDVGKRSHALGSRGFQCRIMRWAA
jgi:hypothetical protein